MKIAIIGCGNIEFELAKIWSKKGHTITATTTNKQKLKSLSAVAQKSIIMKESDEKEISILVEENDAIVVTIAADSLRDYEEIYLKFAESLKNAALNCDKPKILLFASSTFVYGDHKGQWVDENSSINTTDANIKMLFESEETLLKLKEYGWTICILRISSIYGIEKGFDSIIKRTYKNKLAGHGNYYTNMVHIQDVVASFDYALSHKLWGIFNIADDDHPTRQEFIDAICQKENIPKITWDSTLVDFDDANKRISNHKLKASGYVLRFPHRII